MLTEAEISNLVGLHLPELGERMLTGSHPLFREISEKGADLGFVLFCLRRFGERPPPLPEGIDATRLRRSAAEVRAAGALLQNYAGATGGTVPDQHTAMLIEISTVLDLYAFELEGPSSPYELGPRGRGRPPAARLAETTEVLLKHFQITTGRRRWNWTLDLLSLVHDTEDLSQEALMKVVRNHKRRCSGQWTSGAGRASAGERRTTDLRLSEYPTEWWYADMTQRYVLEIVFREHGRFDQAAFDRLAERLAWSPRPLEGPRTRAHVDSRPPADAKRNRPQTPGSKRGKRTTSRRG